MKKIIPILIFFILLCSFTYANYIDDLNNGTVAYWEFEDLTDNTGVYTLTNNGATSGATGIINNAYDFNSAANDYMRFSAFDGNLTTEFSICGWFNPDNYTVFGNVFDFADNTRILLQQQGDGTIYFQTKDTAGAWHVLTSTTTFNNTGWFFFCGIYDNVNVYYYINNNLEDSEAMTGIRKLNGGTNDFGGLTYYDGIIDEFMIFDFAINSTHREFLYNNSNPSSSQQYIFSGSVPPPIDHNLTLTLDYPVNKTIFYGTYNNSLVITLDNVNGSATCNINDSRWNNTIIGIYNETVLFMNNTAINDNNISIKMDCYDLDQTINTSFWFYQENILNLTFWNEEDLSLMNGTNITVELISGSYVRNTTTTTGYVYMTQFPTGELEIQFTAEDYVIRQNYFNVVAGTSYKLDLYLLNSSLATQIMVEINDEFGEPIEGYRLFTYRRILGQYYSIEVSRTNWEGKGDFYGLLSTPMYYWIIKDYDDVIYKQTGETEIYGTTLPFYIVRNEPISHIYSKQGQLYYTLTYDNTTKTFTYNFIDSTASSTEARLTVRKYPTGELVATNSTTSTTGILSVDISSLYINGSSYQAVATMNYSPSTYVDSVVQSFSTIPFEMQDIGLLISLIIIVLFAFVGLWNPAVMLIMEGLAVFFTRAVGLHHLSYTVCIIITLLCLIISYLISDRS